MKYRVLTSLTFLGLLTFALPSASFADPITPEPASYALLGFGGLLLVSCHFLRRKR